MSSARDLLRIHGWYTKLMTVLALVYTVAGLSFLIAPDKIFWAINTVHAPLGIGLPIPDSTERFWLVLTFSMMMMLAVLSLQAASNPRNLGYAWVHLASKLISSAGFVTMYFVHEKYAAYLVGFTTDFPLAVIVAFAMVRVTAARWKAEGPVSEVDLRTLDNLIRVLCSGDRFVLSRIDIHKVTDRLQRNARQFPPLFMVIFKVGLYFLEFGGPPIAWKLRRFTRMRPGDRIKHVQEWAHSKIFAKRNIFKLLKATVMTAVTNEEALVRAIGFDKELDIRRTHSRKKGLGPGGILGDDFKKAIRNGRTFDTDAEERFDAVVVGSGAGGAVIAKELSEGGMKVAIVEEGDFHSEHKDLAVEAIGRLYRDFGLTSTLGNPVIPVPMGRCVGGTTVINSGTCFRTPDSVLNRWRDEFGLKDLRSDEMTRAFERVEQELHVTPVPFELMSRTNSLTHDLLKKEGLGEGHPLHRDVVDCEGCGMCCYGCTSGAKQSMDVSYLPKAVAAGAVLYTNCQVDTVLTDGSGKATGIVGIAGKRRKLTLRADRIIIAAGTFHSPQILRRSGLPSGNRHVGRHLTLHPATKVYGQFDEKINGWNGVPQSYGWDGMKKEGIMFEGIFMPPDMAGMSFPHIGAKLVNFLKNYSNMSSYGFMISDTSEGRLIRIPGIGYSFLYSLTDSDAERFKKGTAFIARLYLKGGAKRVFTHLGPGFEELKDLSDVERLEAATLNPREIETMAFHPLGTCRMGPSAAKGVVGPDHQVFGVKGLYVCDGSVIPSALGVNPQVTIMALATRLAGRLLNQEIPGRASRVEGKAPARKEGVSAETVSP